MLVSLACMIILGFSLSGIFKKINLPGILAMILTGIILGPHLLNLIAPELLAISAEIRTIALIVILLRAGLSLNLQELKKVGRPAILLCFVPATCEIIAITLLAPLFFTISTLEAAIMGTILAAVSPAVIVPRMLFLMENNYGRKKGIPQLIMAGASVDDIYVIVLFTSFINMFQGQGFQLTNLVNIPLSVVLGVSLGIIGGLLLSVIFKKIAIRDTIKLMLILSLCFLFIALEDWLKPVLALSGLIAVMSLGSTLTKRQPQLSTRLLPKFAKVWVIAELFLFVLVGASVNITVINQSGLLAIFLIAAALLFRIAGVFLSLVRSGLTFKEQLFCTIAYLPKATVQAAIGSIPLSLGLPAGELILTVSVIAILVTAPLGAIGIDQSYQRLLSND